LLKVSVGRMKNVLGIWASAAHCATKATIQAGIAMMKVTRNTGCRKTEAASKPFSNMLGVVVAVDVADDVAVVAAVVVVVVERKA
jgi:hypothetical protein